MIQSNLKSVVFLLLTGTIAFTSCKKETSEPEGNSLTNQELQLLILTDFSYKVALANYSDMENKMLAFYSSCVNLENNTAHNELQQAQQEWKNARQAWEQSEAFLFGPVSTNNIDPSIDTWPVDFVALDSLLNTSHAFTQSFINSLGDELKGFHPAEYLLWGPNGTKTPAQFTPREIEFLVALAADLQLKATMLRTSWDTGTADNYSDEMIEAGSTNSIYGSQRAAFEEIVNGMIGICDEVANGKLFEPFNLQDPTLEESPFSSNSMADFTNNIRGVRNVYHGKYTEDGYGLNDFMMNNNLSLHNKIENQITNALNALNGISVPFGQAITQQPTQVQNAIDQINVLKATLEDELLLFLQQTITE